jgi:TIR domain
VAEDGDGSAPGTSVDAFVSYSRRDAGLMLPIVQAAEPRGRSFWFDADDIPGCAAWREELAAAIETADAVVSGA